MSIPVVCPKCRASYAVSDELMGKKIRCRKCEAPLLIASRKPKEKDPEEEEEKEKTGVTAKRPAPAARPAAGKKPARPRDDDPDEEEEDERPRRKGKPVAKGTNPLVFVGVGVGAVVVVAAVAVVAIVMMNRPGSQPVAVNNPPPFQPQPMGFQPPLGNNPAVVPQPAVQTDPKPGAAAGQAEKGDTGLTAAVLKRVKGSTVHLRVALPNGGGAEGSGFFGVKPGYILTNAHVLGMLDPDSRQPKAIQAVLNSGENNERAISASILTVDRDSDLAVLKATAALQDLPPPLEVASAEGLTETQKVFIFGFPFGDALGSNITVSESSVSSLRREGGQLVKVQVNGGMHPGNSGGPVVTARGEVVGVAVSVIKGSQINFAVPGDFIHALIKGRLAAFGTGQPFLGNGDALGFPATVTMLDPMEVVKEVAVDYWTGDPGEPRPARGKPEPAAGDSERTHVVLGYRKGEGRADVTLPPLPAGKVYWVQPNWVNGAGESKWVAATPWKPSSQPVRRVAAGLFFKQQKGSRRLTLDTTMSSKFHIKGLAEASAAMTSSAEVQEKVLNVTRDNVDVRYTFSKLAPKLTINGQEEPLPDDVKIVKEAVGQAVLACRVNAAGEYQDARLDLGKVRPEAKPGLEALLGQLRLSLQTLSLPLPNREVQPGEQWTAWRECPMRAAQVIEMGSLDMTYTYLGRRARDGKEEAVIALAGVLGGGKGQEGRMGGRATGSALLDLTTGQLTLAKLTVKVDMDTFFLESAAKSIGTLDVTLTRVSP